MENYLDLIVERKNDIYCVFPIRVILCHKFRLDII